MRSAPLPAALRRLAAVFCLTLPLAAAGPDQIRAGDRDVARPIAARATQPADSCSFYRGQAWGKGLAHFSQEMLWTCEAIAARRQAGFALSDRLAVAATALEAFRATLLADANQGFREARASGRDPFAREMSNAEKEAIARATGALDALAQLSGGF